MTYASDFFFFSFLCSRAPSKQPLELNQDQNDSYMKNNSSKKVPYFLERRQIFSKTWKLETHDLSNFPLVSLMKTPGFGVHALPSTSTLTLSLGPKRNDHPSSVDRRENVEPLSLLSPSSLSLSTNSCQKMALFLLFVLTSLKSLVWPTSRHVSTPISGSFLNRNGSFVFSSIYFK